jgi:hypothetical protein
MEVRIFKRPPMFLATYFKAKYQNLPIFILLIMASKTPKKTIHRHISTF